MISFFIFFSEINLLILEKLIRFEYIEYDEYIEYIEYMHIIMVDILIKKKNEFINFKIIVYTFI